MRLRALEEAPYAFGSTLADWQGDGDTEQRWRERLSSVALSVIADLDEKPAGMVSTVTDDAAAELISMWVAPFARGRGVGDALVEVVIQWAAGARRTIVRLSVMDGNDHASALYHRHGFVDAGPNEDDVGPGEPAERWMIRQ